ncbi:hypothetical protein CYMTET_47622 [Cymbomonas tetramitiformis]|uniref:Uncharacterized protein n=1 Tax=Cymbomonas tetramitiformis TaxID=36881 RepID=A0AAE0BTV8_9CHLO|nr:hypothetical protein CYMTET_47622 [Cymbomonas tetramitiformis]
MAGASTKRPQLSHLGYALIVFYMVYMFCSTTSELREKVALNQRLEENARTISALEDALAEERKESILKQERIEKCCGECVSKISSKSMTQNVLGTQKLHSTQAHAAEVADNHKVQHKAGVSFGAADNTLAILYATYAADLMALRSKMKSWADQAKLHAGIGDLEAEVLYLRIRALKPKNVAELGFGQGLCTMYLLHALQDNGSGELTTFDIVDEHNRAKDIDPSLKKRWKLVIGDGRDNLPKYGSFQYVHSDAEHSVSFAQWLVSKYLEPRIGQSIQVSFHDVFISGSKMNNDPEGITPEGRVVLSWLAKHQKTMLEVHSVFCIAQSAFTSDYDRVRQLRADAGLDEEWIATKASAMNQPSIFFEV